MEATEKQKIDIKGIWTEYVSFDIKKDTSSILSILKMSR